MSSVPEPMSWLHDNLSARDDGCVSYRLSSWRARRLLRCPLPQPDPTGAVAYERLYGQDLSCRRLHVLGTSGDSWMAVSADHVCSGHPHVGRRGDRSRLSAGKGGPCVGYVRKSARFLSGRYDRPRRQTHPTRYPAWIDKVGSESLVECPPHLVSSAIATIDGMPSFSKDVGGIFRIEHTTRS